MNDEPTNSSDGQAARTIAEQDASAPDLDSASVPDGFGGVTLLERNCESLYEKALRPTYVKYQDCDDFFEDVECGMPCMGDCQYGCEECIGQVDISINACGSGGRGHVFRLRRDGMVDFDAEPRIARAMLPIDSLGEAVTYLELNQIAPTHYREADDGYDFIYRGLSSDCAPVAWTRYWIHLASNGAWGTFKEVEIKRWEGACI